MVIYFKSKSHADSFENFPLESSFHQMNLAAMRLEALQHEIAYASVLHAWMVSNS